MAVDDQVYMAASFLLVGALWGCTNATLAQATKVEDHEEEKERRGGGVFSGLKSLAKTKVWEGEGGERVIYVSIYGMCMQ